jgi:hypothetical protein
VQCLVQSSSGGGGRVFSTCNSVESNDTEQDSAPLVTVGNPTGQERTGGYGQDRTGKENWT